MTVRELIVIKILLLVARMIADDEWAVEIRHLANHISSRHTWQEDFHAEERRRLEGTHGP